MTTELEEQFFKVFGIEPKNKCGKNLIYPNCLNLDKCGYENCIYYQIEYPDITAEKFLQMICIYNSTYTNGFTNYSLLNERNIEELKKRILKNCLIVKDDIKLKIQQLLRRENE